MIANRTELQRLATMVRAELDELDKAAPYAPADAGYEVQGRHRAARKEALGKLVDKLVLFAGVRITDRWDGARVRLGGFSSSSTSGVEHALRNWAAAAERRATT